MKQIFSEITEFRAELAVWFERHGRRLPWRATNDPYAILVSELMLQQTQVATVIGYYQRWFELSRPSAIWPMPMNPKCCTPGKDLVITTGPEICTNARRSLSLSGDEKFPSAVDELTKLPGIGRYTAGAVASFAFNLPAPIVDANIERVLSRLLNLQEPVDQPAGGRVIWDFASQYVQGPIRDF